MGFGWPAGKRDGAGVCGEDEDFRGGSVDEGSDGDDDDAEDEQALDVGDENEEVVWQGWLVEQKAVEAKA